MSMVMAEESWSDDEVAAINKRIGRAVSVVLRARGMTAKALAPTVGLTEVTLSPRMNGHTPFKAYELERIAQVLEVPVAMFFRDPTDILSGHLSGYVTGLPGPDGEVQLSLDDELAAVEHRVKLFAV